MNAIRKFTVYKQSNGKENIIYLSGELDLSAASELATVLDSVVQKGNEILTLDLKELRYIDSTGIGMIVSVLKVRAAMKAAFRIHHIPAKIQRLFELTGIARYLVDREDQSQNQGGTERKEESI
ncbi:STAS domain-containing protein [Paenibacillus alginolyticus]|uniref:Anti-sigma factor antagonist n=1 Tax=Paenibacillus alginolyticus TaxID=59839 RepID=A0ABT4GNG0_9BACL|nr:MULTISPECIES: STAS domain-containing protein [Paenibacillus]MCY9697611.1 STAS domain-containing protein [Paenibacillus alginolyticus]MEC0145317.1 STAS domain-containing protein [Paenibacillus alginolyticus]NRF92177.1 STAS domain-containing protein [Paenibacillus frigoriresistens]